MKRGFLFVLTLFTVFSINTAHGQEESYEEYKRREPVADKVEPTEPAASNDGKGWSWSNFRVGGNFGLQFGTRTYIDLSPTIGYQVKKWVQVGISTKFIYFSQKRDIAYVNSFGQTVGVVPAFKSVIGGIGTYAQFYPYKGLIAHIEYELINKDSYDPSRSDRVNVNHIFVGAGYAIPMGNAGSFNILATYEIIDDPESIYSGTFGGLPLILRMGFSVGLGNRR